MMESGTPSSSTEARDGYNTSVTRFAPPSSGDRRLLPLMTVTSPGAEVVDSAVRMSPADRPNTENKNGIS